MTLPTQKLIFALEAEELFVKKNIQIWVRNSKLAINFFVKPYFKMFVYNFSLQILVLF